MVEFVAACMLCLTVVVLVLKVCFCCECSFSALVRLRSNVSCISPVKNVT